MSTSEKWLFWVGCAGSFDQRSQSVARSFGKVLEGANVPYEILGEKERCCGDPARRMGNDLLFQDLMEANRNAILALAPAGIVTACPHCYRVLKHEYGLGLPVAHHSVFIAGLLTQSRLDVTALHLKGPLAYHDSCYLCRYEGIIREPRAALRAVSAASVEELPRSGVDSFCCGGGGGRVFLEEREGERINHLRAKEIQVAGVQTVITACPFCKTMLSDASADLGEPYECFDLAEVVARAMSSS